MTRSDLNVGSSAMPIQTEGAKWIFNEDKVARLSLQRLHNCKILSVIFSYLSTYIYFLFFKVQYCTFSVQCGHVSPTYDPELSGVLQVPTHRCRLRSYLTQEKAYTYAISCSLEQIPAVTKHQRSSPASLPAVWPILSSSTISSSVLLFSLICLRHISLCASFPVFTLLSFLTSYFCLPAHLPPSCTAAEDIFSVHHYLWSLRSALLHRKTLQWSIHLFNLL